MIENILLAIVASMIYAITEFAKKYTNKEKLEEFDVIKFVSTLIVAVVVGIIITYSGLPLNEETVIVQLGTYAGVVVVVENILKTIWRYNS